MAQIADVMDALAILDAARQELTWAYGGDLSGGYNLGGADKGRGTAHELIQLGHG